MDVLLGPRGILVQGKPNRNFHALAQNGMEDVCLQFDSTFWTIGPKAVSLSPFSGGQSNGKTSGHPSWFSRSLAKTLLHVDVLQGPCGCSFVRGFTFRRGDQKKTHPYGVLRACHGQDSYAHDREDPTFSKGTVLDHPYHPQVFVCVFGGE